MITLNFDEDSGVFKSDWTGDVYLKDIIDCIDSVSMNRDLPRRLRIITDSSKAKLLVQPEELPLIVEANLKRLDYYDTIIDAMIPANPHDTALAILYMELAAIAKYSFRIFSTPEAALKWLKNY